MAGVNYSWQLNAVNTAVTVAGLMLGSVPINLRMIKMKMKPLGYAIDNFIEYSHFHLSVKIAKKKLERNGYMVISPFYLKDKKGYEFFFEAGFESDGGTIPWFLWPVLRYNGRAMAAFLIHDQACDEANKMGCYVIRKSGDGDLYRHLRDCGIAKWIAKAAGKAVLADGLILKARGKLV